MRKLDDLAVGYILACSNMYSLHGCDVEASDTLLQLGLKKNEILNYDWSEFDRSNLMQIFELEKWD